MGRFFLGALVGAGAVGAFGACLAPGPEPVGLAARNQALARELERARAAPPARQAPPAAGPQLPPDQESVHGRDD